MDAIIEIKNLTKSYGAQRGIEEVNLVVNKGEIFGFIGPNGAGKSTTIRTLLGLIHPTQGSALVFGKDCIAYRDENARRIGYLPSEVFYYDRMLVKDVLAYAASFYDKDCTQRIDELCALLALDVTRKVADLSYGNRKKLGIVQGLLHEPDLIILDEPTSGLDPLMQNKFFALMHQENARGATIFFSSHILGEVQKLCARVALIKEGRIVRVDTMENIRKSTCKYIEIMAKDPTIMELEQCEGVSDFSVHKEVYTCIYSGDINRFIAYVSNFSIESIDIREPDLEDVFIKYYEGV